MSENLRVPEVNKTMVVGRVTRDLELRYTPSKLAVTTISVAVNRSFKDSQTGEWKDSTSFIPVVIWGKQAESASSRLKKGSPVYIEGHLQSRSWETKQGEKRTTLELVCERVQFLTKIDSNFNNSENVVKVDKQSDASWDIDENIESLDEEIPF